MKLALASLTILFTVFAQQAAHASPCDVRYDTTDSNSRTCASQYAVIAYVPGQNGIFWDTYRETCFSDEQSAKEAMAKAQHEGVCDYHTPKAAHSSAVACEVLYGTTDSNTRTCDNQYAVIAYVPTNHGLFWSTVREKCFSTKAEAQQELKAAREIGLCK